MMHPEAGTAIANDDWISDDSTPDPTPLPSVVGWSLLVRPVVIRSKTKGGILLPAKTKDDIAYLTTVGRVLALGSMAYTGPNFVMTDGSLCKPWCKVGDFVCYGKFKGTKFTYKGVKLLLINDDDVRMVLANPDDLNPMSVT